jgi:hypothetical protein
MRTADRTPILLPLGTERVTLIKHLAGSTLARKSLLSAVYRFVFHRLVNGLSGSLRALLERGSMQSPFDVFIEQ